MVDEKANWWGESKLTVRNRRRVCEHQVRKRSKVVKMHPFHLVEGLEGTAPILYAPIIASMREHFVLEYALEMVQQPFFFLEVGACPK